MNYLETADWDSTVHDYEFTRKARRQIMEVVNADSFADMPSEDIFQFLLKEISLVSFKDYLKRYLYERAGITEPFRGIGDDVWQDIIVNAFEENKAPHSFGPTTTRWKTTVKSWLNSDRVRRNTIFLLGFGLRMSEEDVADFLTKVLEENSYNMDDPVEVIYRYCFRHQLHYSDALALTEQSKSDKKALTAISENDILKNQSSLLEYIAGLRGTDKHDFRQESACSQFVNLYEKCKKVIAQIYQKDEEEKPEKERKQWSPDDISAADLEKMLCSGIPTTESGNLVKSSSSLLNKHFQNYRLSRQRTDGIIKKQLQPDRYDLITVSFFLHSQLEEITGEERLSGFLREVNTILESCGMYQMHPANPYEAFIMICILSDCPLSVYGDIWEMSFDDSFSVQ